MNPEAGIGTAPHITLFFTFSLITPATKGSHQHPPHSAQAQARQGVSNFADGSGLIFAMYSDMATEEDKKMAESWKADADGILIFVRLHHLLVLQTDSMVVDRVVLCCCCIIDLSVNSGHSTKLAGYLQLLSCKHLSSYCSPESTEYFPLFLPAPIFSTKLRRLGERTLVLELGDQSYLCSTGDVATAMGTKIPQSHPVAICSSQASSNPCVSCRRS